MNQRRYSQGQTEASQHATAQIRRDIVKDVSPITPAPRSSPYRMHAVPVKVLFASIHGSFSCSFAVDIR
jgi:hypothetical protein